MTRPVTETLAGERARLAARIEAIDAEMAALDTRGWFLALPWSHYSEEHARTMAYSVPVSLRVEVLALAPEHLRVALAEGYRDRDGVR